MTGSMERFGGGEKEGWVRGDLKGRVLRLLGDLGRGCTGGVWVTGVGRRGMMEGRARGK